MSPYSCGMAAIPVRPENHGTRAAGAYDDGPYLLPPYLLPPCLLPLRQLHPSAAVSRLLSPGLCCLPAAAVSCPPPFLVLRRFLSSAVSCPPSFLVRAVSCPPCRRAKAACPHLPALRASVRRLVPACVLDIVHHDPARARRAGRNARIGRERPLAARIEILRMQPVAFGDGACELFVEFL